MAQTRNGKPEYVKLEQRLVLLAWLNGDLRYESNRDLLADIKGTAEGFDASGRSKGKGYLFWEGIRREFPMWEQYLKGETDDPPAENQHPRALSPMEVDEMEALLLQALRGIDPVSRQCIFSATMQTLMDISEEGSGLDMGQSPVLI